MDARDSYDTVGVIVGIHALINGFLVAAVHDVPEARMTEQPGGIRNHPAWTLSHLNAYAGLLLVLLDDPSVPTADDEMARYGYGSTPVPDPAAYATKRELFDRFRERNARLGAGVSEKHGTHFPRPAPERFRPHAPTIGHVAITLLVAHPAHHLGQLRQWRRAAGLADRA